MNNTVKTQQELELEIENRILKEMLEKSGGVQTNQKQPELLIDRASKELEAVQVAKAEIERLENIPWWKRTGVIHSRRVKKAKKALVKAEKARVQRFKELGIPIPIDWKGGAEDFAKSFVSDLATIFWIGVIFCLFIFFIFVGKAESTRQEKEAAKIESTR